MNRLLGKKAIVTGGTRGIGKAIALLFAQEGASVAIFGTNEERGKEILQELKSHAVKEDQKFLFRRVDVSKYEETEGPIKEILEEWEGIDILVNSAGITRDQLMIRLSEKDWDDVIDTNLKSIYNMIHPIVRRMIKQRFGKIINIASVIGLTGNAGQTNYAASKMGMIGFTKSLAREVGGRNISVNCIAPGYIDTDMTNAVPEGIREKILERIPMGRMGQPLEIAYAALFLASEESNYITGQVLTVDGGMIA
jgi:3-oxoacyl-[acyl-carrier protein] reductase